jgi:peptide deformylase
MTKLPILSHDHPVLRKRAKEVKKITPEIVQLCEDMLETMKAAPGSGLAANQVGATHRVIVVEFPEDDDDPLSGRQVMLINPELSGLKGSQVGSEGCLSLPGYVGEVERAAECVVKATTPAGKRVRFKTRDYAARILQHEVDHLDGVVYIDRLVAPDRIRKLRPDEKEDPAG